MNSITKREKVGGVLAPHVDMLFREGILDEIDAIYAAPSELGVKKEVQYWVSRNNGMWYHHHLTRADKYSDAVETTRKVLNSRIDYLWNLIQNRYELPPNPFDPVHKIDPKYRWNLPHIAVPIIKDWNLHCNTTEFNGGGQGNRTRYHDFYIYPIHVLDHEKKVRFGQTSWRLQ